MYQGLLKVELNNLCASEHTPQPACRLSKPCQGGFADKNAL